MVLNPLITTTEQEVHQGRNPVYVLYDMHQLLSKYLLNGWIDG